MQVYIYSGQINSLGYEQISNLIDETQDTEPALLILATPGGDAHAGFRIARALQHRHKEFHALVPRYCKSAGTLILLGATKLYLADRSELGPLDVQIKKGDEIAGRNSGLDYLQAVSNLQSRAMDGFKDYLNQLTEEMALSTRTASEIASKLITGVFQPIFAQIDPMKLAEMQRATEIAYAYGERLADRSGNLKPGMLPALITAYPSHGFVIDRKEARSIFKNVDAPTGPLLQLCHKLNGGMLGTINNDQPVVKRQELPAPSAGEHNDHQRNPPALREALSQASRRSIAIAKAIQTPQRPQPNLDRWKADVSERNSAEHNNAKDVAALA